ncbi:MAG TPA: caspase family protein [Pyrinomonadaceae bacterium]
MSRTTPTVLIGVLLLSFLVLTARPAVLFHGQEPKPQQQPPEKQDRGLGVQAAATPTPVAAQTNTAGNKPEIVLQAGITSPQTQISFSPDGRLLASMGMFGNSIKLWEISTGRLLRQLESSIPTMGASSLSRPFRFSRDGRTITAITEGRVRRWDIETGRELNNTLLSISRDFLYAFLSDDAQTVAFLKMDNSAIKVYDTAAGRELYSAGFEKGEQLLDQDSFALSGDGKFLAVLTETVKASMKGGETRIDASVWDIAQNRKTRTIRVSAKPMQFGVATNPPGSILFSPDGSTLAIRNENTVTLWDVNTGQEVKTINAPTLPSTQSDGLAMFMSKFAFSSDRRFVSVLGDGDKINIVDVTTGNPSHILPGHDGRVVGLSFSMDGHLFASSGTDDKIKLWDVASGREVKSLSGSAMPISDLAFSIDGKSLMLAGNEAVSSWELGTGGVRRAVIIPKSYSSASGDDLMRRQVILSRDSRFMIAGDKDNSTAKVWETATGKEAQSIALDPQKQLSSATFSRNGALVVLVDRDKPKPKSSPTPSTVAQTPSGGLPNGMTMPDMSKIMEQMRKDPKKAEEQMKKVQEAMAKGDLSAGMTMMESMGMMPTTNSGNKTPNTLRVVELSSGRQLQTIPLQSGFFNDLMSNSFMSSSALSVSPDQQMLASATGFMGPVVLRDLKSGQEIRSLKAANTLTTNAIAWSADGKKLATAHYGLSRNFTDPNAAQFTFEDLRFSIKIWDPQTGTEIGALPGHGNFVNALAFSPDGRFLASGSFDSTVKVWDLATGKEITTLKGHSGSITALEFSPDSQFLVSGSDDGSSRLWQVPTGSLMATMVSLNQGSDWLVVTPDGLFDGSPGGWNQILWRFTPGLYDVSPVEIFFNEYFRPGLLPDILAGKKLTAAVDISRKDRRQPKLAVELADQQNPAADIAARTVKLRIRVSEAPAGAQDLRLFRNGSLVKAWRGDVLSGQTGVTFETSVSIVAGQNQFTAYAFNHDNVKSSDATLSLNGAADLKRPATLHLLVVGLNKYANSAYDLKYAAADARAFAEEVEKQQEKLGHFQHIEVTSLIDQEATKANLLFALKRLTGDQTAPPQGAPAVLAQIKPAEPEDVVIVYYAGHGTAQDQRFYLIPHDLGYQGTRTELDRTGLQTILEHSVSDLELEQAFTGIDAGLVVMVIDACNSGQALEAEEKRRGPMNSKGLAQLAYEKGMYILTAAQSYQAALEAEQLGHGYLTFALVEEGLKSGAADNEPHDNQVLLREWLDYATERVPRMQEAKMRDTRGVGLGVAFVEGEQKVTDVDKRTLQRPRVFYRREEETEPLVVAKP